MDPDYTQEGLRRKIGVLGLSANLVNIIVGAGIFVLPAIVAAGLGAASVLAYLFCGVLLMLIMLCFAEAGSKITTTGGAYTYIEVAFGSYAGFITAVLFLISCITADAAVSNALVAILGTVFPVFKLPYVRILFFLTVFGVLAFINIIGVQRGIGLVKILTIVKLIPLVLLVTIGWKDVSFINLQWETIPGMNSVGQMALILFFAFQGAESGLAVSGEVKNPRKNIPRGILIGIGGVLILYILIQTVSQGVLGSSLANYQEAPLAEVANRVFGPIGLVIMTGVAAVSMFGNLSGEVLSMPRVLFGAARDKVIPSKMLSGVHSKYATPVAAIVVYAGLGLTFAIFGGFRQLAVISGASILLVYLGVALSVLKLRKTHARSSNEFRIPGGFIVPVASVLIIGWFLSNLEVSELLWLVVFVSSLTVVYLIVRRLRNDR
jgi:basic amino acid/polyamine antiporter, APA family